MATDSRLARMEAELQERVARLEFEEAAVLYDAIKARKGKLESQLKALEAKLAGLVQTMEFEHAEMVYNQIKALKDPTAEGARPGDRVDDQPAEKPKQRGTKRPRTSCPLDQDPPEAPDTVARHRVGLVVDAAYFMGIVHAPIGEDPTEAVVHALEATVAMLGRKFGTDVLGFWEEGSLKSYMRLILLSVQDPTRAADLLHHAKERHRRLTHAMNPGGTLPTVEFSETGRVKAQKGFCDGMQRGAVIVQSGVDCAIACRVIELYAGHEVDEVVLLTGDDAFASVLDTCDALRLSHRLPTPAHLAAASWSCGDEFDMDKRLGSKSFIRLDDELPRWFAQFPPDASAPSPPVPCASPTAPAPDGAPVDPASTTAPVPDGSAAPMPYGSTPKKLTERQARLAALEAEFTQLAEDLRFAEAAEVRRLIRELQASPAEVKSTPEQRKAAPRGVSAGEGRPVQKKARAAPTESSRP